MLEILSSGTKVWPLRIGGCNIALKLLFIEIVDEHLPELSSSLILWIILQDVDHELLIKADDGGNLRSRLRWIYISLVLGILFRKNGT